MQARAQDLARLGPDNLFPSAPARLLDQALHRPNAPAYAMHNGTDWVKVSWAQYADDTKRAARALIALGLKRDQSVAILGFNRPEWTTMAHGVMMVGARPAGVYWTCAPPEISYILNHSEAPIFLVQTQDHAREAISFQEKCSNLKTIIVMDGWHGEEPHVMSWDTFLAKGEDQYQGEVSERLKAIEAEHIGPLIYTSGTTGPPKAVMLSHGNASWAAASLVEMFKPQPNDRGLSYLPIAHIAEQQASVHNHVASGNTLYFSRGLDFLAEDLKASRPHTFFGVPRVWEKMHETLQARLSQTTGPRAALVDWARSIATQWHKVQMAGRSADPVLVVKIGLARALVLNKIKAALGLGHARFLISGAAPISQEILWFFASLDLVLYEGYGQSETSAPTTFNKPGQARLGSVGKLIPGMQSRISEEGELQLKGPNVFVGYMKNNEATESTFTRDGWMRTGDLIEMDEDEFFYITGRIKDIIITSGGKNITPANIETDLMNDPLVEHAVIVGEAKPYLCALLTLSDEALVQFAIEHSLDAEQVRDSQILTQSLQACVDRVNQNYARVENIRKFKVLPKALSIEAGELTPTMKVRRNVVTERNIDLVSMMYAKADTHI